MSSNLGNIAAKGAVWSIGGQVVSLGIYFVSMAILGRLVSPAAFGIVAMVTAIVGLGELIRDFGLTNAVIQAPTISDAEKNNLFWLNAGIGLVLGIGFFFAAGSIATFYDSSEIIRVVQVLSLTFVVNGLTTQPKANLIRDLRTKTIATIDVAAAVLGLAASAIIAIMGYGLWAIVALQLGRYISTMVFTFIAARFVPQKPRRDVSIRRFVRFGLSLFGAQLMVYISSQVDTILIGRVLGAQPLGYYSRAYQLGLMPSSQMVSPLSRVTLPMLSRLSDSQHKFESMLVRTQTILTTSTAALYCLALVFGDIIVRVLLGPDWGESVILFRILCIVGMASTLNNVSYWIFVSKGAVNQQLLHSVTSRPVLILAIALAVPHGVEAIAWTLAGWTMLSWPISLWWANRRAEIPARKLLVNGGRALCIFALITGTGLVTRAYTDVELIAAEILLSMASMSVVFGGLYLISAAVRRDVRDTLSIASLLRQSPLAPNKTPINS